MARVVFLCLVLFSSVICKPTENVENNNEVESRVNLPPGHSIWKRFINPGPSFGSFSDAGMTRMRTKRYVSVSDFGENSLLSNIRTKRSSEEECKKLRLCKLHAKSNRNFLAAFQLYFVNKENARLWDHHRHSIEDCRHQYNACYKR